MPKVALQRFDMTMLLAGLLLLLSIIGLFWAKDKLQNPTLARIAYSEPIARLAVVGAVLMLVGFIMTLSRLFES